MSFDLDERFNRLEAKVDMILQQIEQLVESLNTTKQSCAHMDEHIEFVESVYDSVRHPLNFIANKFSSKPAELPAPPTK